MTFRGILTASLLLFVAAGVATLAVKALRDPPASTGPSSAASRDAVAVGRQVTAYYFLGKVRCSSCRRIEEVSRRTIETSFRQELADGRLRFLVVNVDEPENRHFVEEFRLDASALVLVETRDGRPAGWKTLPDVWTLADDIPKLEKYVRDELASGLKGL